ncbi:MAG TPA: hypothetical protein VMJ30_06325 [Gemmatimonadales bacterium]|nr:hypothetical protein [Gemmatimonadales bacterium]
MRTLSGITLVLAVFLAAGCAGGVSGVGPATEAPTVDISGKWVGTWVATNPALGSGYIEMTLKQTGSQYDGNLTITGSPTDPSGYTQGVVSGNQVRVLQPTSLTGSLTAQGDSMTGGLQGVIAINVTLKRQK